MCGFIPLEQRMYAFFASLFYFGPLVWMFHSQKLNTKINNLHYRALRMVYHDETSSFSELLAKDDAVTIHHRNLQLLAIEMYKVFKGIAPAFLSDIFKLHSNADTENVSANTRSGMSFYNPCNPSTVKYGLETLKSLGPKIWSMVPVDWICPYSNQKLRNGFLVIAHVDCVRTSFHNWGLCDFFFYFIFLFVHIFNKFDYLFIYFLLHLLSSLFIISFYLYVCFIL